MKEYLNANTLFVTIAMYVSDNSRLVLVVEGDDDHLTLKYHCSQDLLLVPGTGGKQQVLRTAALANQHGLTRVRFLVDRDYDEFSLDPASDIDSVLTSESHDCFVDIALNDSKLLQKLIDFHLEPARRRPGNGQNVPTPNEVLFEARSLAGKLASARVVDSRKKLSLNFKNFPFGALKSTDPEVREIVHMVISRSGSSVDCHGDLVSEVERTHRILSHRLSQIVGDHDLFAALARVLKRFKVSVSDKELQKGFMLSISCNAVAGTMWQRKIDEWCGSFGMTGFDCDVVQKHIA